MSKYIDSREYLLCKVDFKPTEDSVKQLLLTNTLAAKNALVYLVALENDEEHLGNMTYDVLSRNRRGLSIYDFNGLYRIIKKVLKKQILTKQENDRVRELLPKYSGQIAYFLTKPGFEFGPNMNPTKI